MRVDVLALQRFYASPLGAAAVRMIDRRLAAIWPDAAGLDMLALGYPLPLIERYRAGSRRTIALMPAAQGAECWPAQGAGLAVLADEMRLPFPDALFDRVLLIHALEEAENASGMLREIWRVTAPEGRIVVVVANRLGLWARADSTPFGHGRPYSRRQLAQLLSDALFQPVASARALYAPPIGWLAKAAMPIERVGAALWPAFGGLVLMEAQKRLYAEPGKQRRKILLAPARQSAARLAEGAALSL